MGLSAIPMRKLLVVGTASTMAAIEIVGWTWYPPIRLAYLVVGPIALVGFMDMIQTKQTIRRNFPIIGRLRYMMEMIRPEIMQYFVESDVDGRPFDRRRRSNIYQRAKRVLNTKPFGTQLDVYETGYEWIAHSVNPVDHKMEAPRVVVGGEDCRQPYAASILNISAMSYGSLSKNAVLALNKGAKVGEFAHNTGEGGLSDYHLEHGGDIIWQIGTGYFGCRTPDGDFNEAMFREKSQHPHVKMIEIKLSQGAKPGHGGILPAVKVTEEVARIRAVPAGKAVISPPYHKAFSTPKGLIEFVTRLREASGGKPVGFKLCLGRKHEFLAICKAMIELNQFPDFITLDGAEGGTGAAPMEFSDSVGMPLLDSLVFVQNTLVGLGLRKKMKIIVAGKVTTGFDIAQKLAIGADMCNSARGMMFALGCIQALECHSNTCPTGVATQKPELVNGLVVEDKYIRVANFHGVTLRSFMELLGAAGLHAPSELRPHHVYRRVSQSEVKPLNKIYPFVAEGALMATVVGAETHNKLHAYWLEDWRHEWQIASSETFQAQESPEDLQLAIQSH